MDESRQNQKEYEETRRQIEEDADREILDIKNKYERRLRDEKEANSRLKGETGILTKKVIHRITYFFTVSSVINIISCPLTKLSDL